MRAKMLATMLFGAALAILLFIVVNLGAKSYIEVNYLSEESKEAREKGHRDDLQAYITKNGLTSDDTDDIAIWAKQNQYVYVLISKDDVLLFESGQYDEDEKTPETGENKDDEGENPPNSGGSGENPDNEPDDGTTGESTGGDGSKDDQGNNEPSDDDDRYPGITVKPPTRDELLANAQKRGWHQIYMSDGGILLASLVDYSEYLYYDIANIVSVILALAAFVITMWVHFFGITKRITKLGKEVTVVAEGNMQHPIKQQGNDEITRLSLDVEYMRTSLLENLEKERNALEANKDLITAMSHDIRTPLTVLLGYIDIMKLNSQDEDMKNYIEATEMTALRLKKMSDDMFGYFLAYGSDIEVNIQESNARTLVEQMIPGYVFLLREQGYIIEYNFEDEAADFLEHAVVITDPPQLMRIVENVFSNVMKYSDKDRPVSVNIVIDNTEMTIKVSNYISKNPNGAQRNGIGLRSCAKLANAMDIVFSSFEDGEIFTSQMKIPLLGAEEYGEILIEDEKRGFKKWMDSVLRKSKEISKKTYRESKKTLTRAEKNSQNAE